MMLVLSGPTESRFDITTSDGERIVVTIIKQQHGKVYLGFDAPRSVTIDRRSVTDAKAKNPTPVKA
jgi:sRNA-binding carbon storage regulator CsrA